MDNFFKLDFFTFLFFGLAFLFLSFDVFAVPALPTFGVVRAGATTTYTVGPSTFQPATVASKGTGLQPLNSAFAAAGRAYATTTSIPVGETIAAVRVTSGISAASLASAALKFSKSPAGIAAIVLGSALYNYLQQSNLAPVPGVGGVGKTQPTTYQNYKTSQFTQCPESDPVALGACACTAAYSVASDRSACMSGLTFNGTNQVTTAGWLYLSVYPSTSGCSSGYSLSGGACHLIGTPTITPVDDAVSLPLLTSNQPGDSAPVISQIHTADSSGASDPVADVSPVVNLDTSPMFGPSDGNFNPGHLSSPQSSTSAPVNAAQPTGTTTSTTTKTDLTQPSATTVAATQTVTTTTTNVDNSTKTTTITNAPAAPTTPPITPQTDCQIDPNRIGCLDYGSVTPDIVQTLAIPAPNTVGSFSSGTCPAAQTMTLQGGKTLTLSNQPLCDFASGSKAFVVSFAYLLAGFIVLGAVKEV